MLHLFSGFFSQNSGCTFYSVASVHDKCSLDDEKSSPEDSLSEVCAGRVGGDKHPLCTDETSFLISYSIAVSGDEIISLSSMQGEFWEDTLPA